MEQTLLTPDAVKDLISSAVGDAVTAALKAVNTVNPDDRPASKAKEETFTTAAFKRRKQVLPSLKRALKSAKQGKLDGFERDVHEAGKALWYRELDDDDQIEGVIWPRNPREMLEVLQVIGEVKTSEQATSAIKAMTESATYALTGGTGGGILVPPEFRQDLFAFALTARNALRRVPGIAVIPVTGRDIRLPRESTTAGASQASEVGTLSSADAVLAQQTIVIEKQYAMRRWSDELGSDSNPAFSVFLDRTVVRDLDIQQDIQWLRGSGVTPQVTGLTAYSNLTTSTAAVVAATNGDKLSFEDVFDAAYDLDAVNATADFAIGHPRAINTLRKTKDANGRYLMSFDGTPRGFGAGRDQAGPDAILADFIPFYKTTNLVINQTVGSSTNCTTIIVGDSSQVLILERQGVELMISPHVYFTTDELAIRAIARSAVAILQPSAVTLLTGVRP